MSQTFYFDKARAELPAGRGLTGKDGVLMPLIKRLTEAAITAALGHHLTHVDKLPQNRTARPFTPCQG